MKLTTLRSAGKVDILEFYSYLSNFEDQQKEQEKLFMIYVLLLFICRLTMASLLSRAFPFATSSLSKSTSSRLVHLSALRNADLMMPDPVEHATGLEKYELLAKQSGNEDPFFLKAVARNKA